MKITEELEIPAEIGVYMSQFCTTRTLLNLTEVSKNWQSIFTSDIVWELHLNKLGVDKQLRQTLLDFYKVTNYKDLYQFLASKNSLISHIDTSLISEYEKDYWVTHKLDLDKIDISDNIKLRISNISDLANLNLTLYTSPLQYHVCKRSQKNVDDAQKLPEGEENVEFAEQILNSFCSHNKKLQINLPLLSNDNCDFYRISQSIISKLGNFDEQGKNTSNSLIRYDEDSLILIHETSKELISTEETRNSDDDRIQHNTKINFILEFNETNWKLLDYRIAFNKEFYANIAYGFQDFEKSFIQELHEWVTFVNSI